MQRPRRSSRCTAAATSAAFRRSRAAGSDKRNVSGKGAAKAAANAGALLKAGDVAAAHDGGFDAPLRENAATVAFKELSEDSLTAYAEVYSSGRRSRSSCPQQTGAAGAAHGGETLERERGELVGLYSEGGARRACTGENALAG